MLSSALPLSCTLFLVLKSNGGLLLLWVPPSANDRNHFFSGIWQRFIWKKICKQIASTSVQSFDQLGALYEGACNGSLRQSYMKVMQILAHIPFSSNSLHHTREKPNLYYDPFVLIKNIFYSNNYNYNYKLIG